MLSSATCLLSAHKSRCDDAMQKYLFIATNEWEWGGSEVLWSEVAERLACSGTEVRVSIPSFGKPLAPVKRVASAGAKIFFANRFL